MDLCAKRPGVILALSLAIAASCVFYTNKNLRIVTDLAALLPKGTASVAALEESKKRIGSTDFFTIAIRSEDGNAQAIANIQDVLQEKIAEKWDDAIWVQVERKVDFFKQRALYYLPQEELMGLRERLVYDLTVEAAAAIPGGVDLLSDDADEEEVEAGPSKGIDGWYNPELPQKLGLPPQIEEAFHSFFAVASDDMKGAKNALPKHLRQRLIGPEGKVGVVLVQLSKPSTDLNYAMWALDRGEKLIQEIDVHAFDKSIRAKVVGAYRSFKEVDAVAADGRIATSISVSLVLLLMVLFFRSLRQILSVFIPLVVAGSLTLALTAVIYGRLTVLTVFVLAMLVGMGIDYGIHLYSRISIEMRGGQTVFKATQTAITDTGKALIMAALTTIASLLTLLASHFEGFKEFAVVASLGLMFCVLSYTVLLPPLIFLFDSIFKQKPAAAPSKTEGSFWDGPGLKRAVTAVFIVGVVLTLIGVYFARSARFEYDFRNLRAKKVSSGMRYGRAVGKKSGTAPAIALGRSHEQMKQFHHYMIDITSSGKAPEIGSFVTLYTFVPEMEDQKRRGKIISQIDELVQKPAFDRLKGKNKAFLTELRVMAKAEPFTTNELPQWVSRMLTEKNGQLGIFGQLYTKIEDWNALVVQNFQKKFGELSFAGQRLPIASSGFILADVVKMVQADGGRLLAVISIALFVLMFAFTQSIKATLTLVAVIVAGSLWCVGAMGLFDIRIGLYNLIVVPVILGVGIDSAIHLYHRHLSLGSERIGENIRTTGFTITASSLTTMAGFMGLLFVSHKGLQTIGVLGCLGVGASFTAVMAVLPFLLVKIKFKGARLK